MNLSVIGEASGYVIRASAGSVSQVLLERQS
jgi:hypothetical protein